MTLSLLSAIEVSDRGASGPWHPGVGLASMRERAAEVGGSLSTDRSAAGSLVRAVLPLAQAQPTDTA